MESWLRISLLLCCFGFFREMRPSEPFVLEFLTSEAKNMTTEEVNQLIYPVGTYAVLAQLIIVFLITDILRYKPIIILSACAGIVLFAFLLWTRSIWELQVGQIFYGTFMASEVAYYTYIYAKVEKERYQIVTGHTRSAILCGKFLGGVLGQLLISTEALDYTGLHYISFGSQIVSLVIACLLPKVARSLYFYAVEKKIEAGEGEAGEGKASSGEIRLETQAPPSSPQFSWSHASGLLWQHTVTAYSKPVVVQWSLWWSLATCGQLMVISYAQFLWKDIDPRQENFYNGGVEATVTILGAVAAMAAGLMNSKRWHSLILTMCSLLMGLVLVVSALTRYVWLAYIMYIVFGICYFFVITIASATVAQNLSDDSFALIFGINTLIALALQTVLTVVVVTDFGYALDPREQYKVYGGYFIALAGLYGVAMLLRYGLGKAKSKKGTREEGE